MPLATPEVKFCYRCGRRIDPKKPSCWYCGAQKDRQLRPAKRCPFCSEYIAHDAVKCRYCGEFLDGREKGPQPGPAPPQQMVFVIDKEVMRAARDRALMPGQPVPADIARHLDAQTLHAIEANQPRLLEQPGVRALPAPEAAQVIDIGPEGRALTTQRELVRGTAAGGAESPATIADTPEGVRRRWGGWRSLFGFFGRRLQRRKRGLPEDIDVKPEDRFRVCERCGAEILRADNYCYHCGMQYHTTKSDERRMQRARGGNPALSMFLLVICIVLVLGKGHIPIGSWNRIIAMVSLLWGLIALIFQRGTLAKLTALFVLLAGALLFILTF